MILVVGLGNPGKKFQKTRHNIGFRVVDEFRKENNFPSFKFFKKSDSLITEGVFNDKKIIVAKPQTFMNNSGKAIKKITNNLQLTTNNLWIIHDDIDLPLGKIRIVKNRGAAGHKGVKSIIDELKTKNFVRFRIGINRFAQNQKLKITPHHFLEKSGGRQANQKLDEFVLEKFFKDEKAAVEEVIQKTVKAIEFYLKQGLEKAMSKFNK